jgi:DNA-binding GntR family transcriptional regulator
MSISESCQPIQCDHGLRRQAIVASLLSDVFQGRIKAGRHLVTRELAGRFGVSHTPIREALIAMAGMGMIDLLPNRGAVVREISEREVVAICRVRRVMECEAVRRACGRIDAVELKALAVAFKRLAEVRPEDKANRVEHARVLDSRLHDRIANSCGNSFLASELSRLTILFRAFRDVAWEYVVAKDEFDRIGEEACEHLAIVEALAVGDRRAAARAMSKHIMGGAVYWGRVVRAGRRREGMGEKP